MSNDILRAAAYTFLNLTNYEYHIVLGRKILVGPFHSVDEVMNEL